MGEIQIWDLAKKELELSKIVGYDTAYGGKRQHQQHQEAVLEGSEQRADEQIQYRYRQ